MSQTEKKSIEEDAGGQKEENSHGATEDILYEDLSKPSTSKEMDEMRDIKKYFEAIEETESSSSDHPERSSLEIFTKESFKSDIDDPVEIKKDAHTKELRPCSSCELLEPVTSIQISGCFGFCKKRKSLKNVFEFWLISVPKQDNTWDTLKDKTQREQLSQNFKFHIPILKVGTLDSLVSLIEQLSTLDNYVKDTAENLVNYMREELTDKQSVWEENLKVNNLNPSVYLTRFAWNKAKYPTWHPISLLADIIYTYVDEIAKSLRQKITLFDGLKSSLKKYEKREQDNLQFRYLGDIVKKEHFVLDSKYLQTLIIVVPNTKVKTWLKSYESMTEMVVPQSSQKIFQDERDSLFTVTLYKKHVKKFTDKARENHFLVRDYKFDEKNMQSEKAYYENLTRVKTRQLAAILRWVKVHFSECFEAWIHTIALRVFVESVLRYGLPVNYQAILLIPLKSKSKLKELLSKLYDDVDSTLAKGHIEEIPGALAMYGVEEYYPYVYFNLDIGFISL